MSKEEHQVQWLFVFDLWLAIFVFWPTAHHGHEIVNYPSTIQHGEQ